MRAGACLLLLVGGGLSHASTASAATKSHKNLRFGKAPCPRPNARARAHKNVPEPCLPAFAQLTQMRPALSDVQVRGARRTLSHYPEEQPDALRTSARLEKQVLCFIYHPALFN